MKKSTLLSILVAFAMIFTLANFNLVSAQDTVEDQYWNLVKNSKSVDDFESYLKEYPKGKYAPLARLKIRLNSKNPPNNNNNANFLITRNSVGDIRIGMTISDARKVFKNAKFEQYNYSEEGIWVEVTKGEKNLMRFTTDQKDMDDGGEDGKVAIDESARIDRIEFSDERYKTADGISVGTTISDAEKSFGKIKKIDFWGLDGSEHPEFANAPKSYSFEASAKKGSGNEARAGIYSNDEVSTKRYTNGAFIDTIRVSKIDDRVLISSNSVGYIRIGMTIAEARKALYDANFSRSSDGEGIALIAVKRNGVELMTIYAGEENPKKTINENAKIEQIEVWSEKYSTSAGVHPKMKISDAAKIYGKIKSQFMSEIESRRYVEFTDQPKYLTFRKEDTDFEAMEKDVEGKQKSYEVNPYIFSITITKPFKAVD